MPLKVLILGGTGMLGHKLWQTCGQLFDTFVTVRQAWETYERIGIFDRTRTVDSVSVEEPDSVENLIRRLRPAVVVNCIGIVKQDPLAKDRFASFDVNTRLPHRLAEVCWESQTRLIHLSTDCVFSGIKGNYNESDQVDAKDLYGQSKVLGEVSGPGCLTLRTSMIGRELAGEQGLVEWFLSQNGKQIRGFKRAVFSGLTTQALSELIVKLIIEHRDLDGLFHVAAEPISKFDLLTLVKESYGMKIEIVPDEEFVCDRSLDGSRFRSATGFIAASWPQMIQRMQADQTPYDTIRSAAQRKQQTHVDG